MTAEFRVERDSMGELKVPADALWGAQTQRAVNNFPISGLPMPPAFVKVEPVCMPFGDRQFIRLKFAVKL